MTLGARLRICCSFLLIPLLFSTSHADATEEEWAAFSQSSDSNPQQAAEDAKQTLLQSRRSGDEKAEMKAIVQLSLVSGGTIGERELERGISLAHKFGDMTAQCLLLCRKAGQKEQFGGTGVT